MAKGDDRSPAYMSISEWSHYIGLSRTVIYERIKSGQIPTVKVGKRRLVDVAAAMAWMKSQAVPAGANAA